MTKALFTVSLNKRLADKGVVSYSLHLGPKRGFILTENFLLFPSTRRDGASLPSFYKTTIATELGMEVKVQLAEQLAVLLKQSNQKLSLTPTHRLRWLQLSNRCLMICGLLLK